MKNRIYKLCYLMRLKALSWLFEISGIIHARIFSINNKTWGITSNDFLQYAPNSLGNKLGYFYKKENIEPIANIECHDAFHVLLGYSTTGIDEGAMQFFLFGNGIRSALSISSCILTILIFPDKIDLFIQEYQKGKQCASIKHWDFKMLLNENVSDLKNKVFNLK